MTGAQWFADKSAVEFHRMVQDRIKDLLGTIAPYHELTHIGIRRDELSERFDMVLHFAPIGTVRVVPETEQPKDPITLYYEDRANGAHAAKAP